MKKLTLVILCLLAACATSTEQRSALATEAKTKMLGMSKNDVLICMGHPESSDKIDSGEILRYHVSDGYRTGMFGEGQTLYCNVSLVFSEGVVSKVSYSGPTGGSHTPDEECAYAVHDCVTLH